MAACVPMQKIKNSSREVPRSRNENSCDAWSQCVNLTFFANGASTFHYFEDKTAIRSGKRWLYRDAYITQNNDLNAFSGLIVIELTSWATIRFPT